jgi:hypothetical protein
LAPMLLKVERRNSSPLPSADWGAEEARKVMTNLKRKLIAVAMSVAMTGVVSFGAFAQRREQEKRPEKPRDTKVVVESKGPKPPPQSNNQGGKKNDGKKGKP